MAKEGYAIPYIAASFRKDAQTLLEGFEKLESLKFKDFAEIWRNLKFSLIYMGRWNQKVLTEFIEECYRNTLMFLDLHRPYIKVGAIFLLYSLYVKQPLVLLKIPVRIVLTLSYLREIKKVEEYHMEGNLREASWELYYIIHSLFKMEAFHVSYSPITLTPVIPVAILYLAPLRKSEFLNSLEDFKLVAETTIQDILSMMQKYEEVKKMLPTSNSNGLSDADMQKLRNLALDIEKYKRCYDASLPLEKKSSASKDAGSSLSVGRRRAVIKDNLRGRPGKNSKRRCNFEKLPRIRNKRIPKIYVHPSDISSNESDVSVVDTDLEVERKDTRTDVKRAPRPKRTHCYED